jgi:hypothetical protein
MFRRSLALPLLAVLTLAAPLSAQTLINQWRFGESDAGAADGNTFGATTTATVGSSNLTVTGTVTYSSNTGGPGSSLSATLGSSAYFSTDVVASLTPTSSFIIETWFKPTTATGNRTLFYNGNGSNSGIGLLLSGANINVLRGGVSDSGGVAGYNLNQWNYVALVYDFTGATGTIKVFVNGATTASYTLDNEGDFNALTAASQTFSVGSLTGSMDETRISTFTSGTFSTSMLSYSSMSAIPEPSTYAAIFGACALGLAAYRRRRRA